MKIAIESNVMYYQCIMKANMCNSNESNNNGKYLWKRNEK